MKSYKIGQTIEKNLYPIEAKMEELNGGNQERLRHLIDVFAPVFVSACLTVMLSGTIARKVDKWYFQILVMLGLFAVFSGVIFLICKIFRKVESLTDNKSSDDKRKRIAMEFYKVLIPEIVMGASLLEKAYEIELIDNKKTNLGEIDAENITLQKLKDGQTLSNKAYLYYYESLYHFKQVKDSFERNQILEFRDSDRKNLKELYELIGQDAIKKAVFLSRRCIEQLCYRINDAGESDLLETFKDYERKLSGRGN